MDFIIWWEGENPKVILENLGDLQYAELYSDQSELEEDKNLSISVFTVIPKQGKVPYLILCC